MDLDFSFALVSSLTPRRKAEKSSPSENQKKTKSLKKKLNLALPLKSQNTKEIYRQTRVEKENLIPKEQLMTKDEFLKSEENQGRLNLSNNTQRRESNDKMLSMFPVNMENIAVRRSRTRGRKKIQANPQPCDNTLQSSSENVLGNVNLPNENLTPVATEVINISSDIDENFHGIQSNKFVGDKVGDRASRLSRVSGSSVRSSLEVVESSSSEMKEDSFCIGKDNFKSLKSLALKKTNVITRSNRNSGVSETSLSTAYDSDSFQAIRRHGAKVIPETPETDKSSKESVNEKSKSSILSFSPEEDKYSLRLDSCSNESPTKNLRSKRKSSEISDDPDDSKKRCSIERSPSFLRTIRKSYTTSAQETNKQVNEFDKGVDNESNGNKLETTNASRKNLAFIKPSKPLNKNNTQLKLDKELRSNVDSSNLDMFRLESAIKDQTPPSEIKNKPRNNFKSTSVCLSTEHKMNIISPVSKEKNFKRADSKNQDPVMKTRTRGKEPNSHKDCRNNSKMKQQDSKDKFCSPTGPKMSTLILPSEVIPKFEHINQWLKDTQEKTIGTLVSDTAKASGISIKDIIQIKNKVSLSPRIKKRKEKAKTSLEEEQKLFQELYGADHNKRLSNDIDEVTSKTSCQESVEFSENVLDKLYGTVWQKDTLMTQSEPRKGKNKNTKNKSPRTERKKHRTSIYEVFSSSSSEDRFEEFLENVQRGKVKSKRRSKRLGTPEFINDSDSEDNASLEFYQNILSSAAKDEVNSLRRDEIMSRQDTHTVNRRRLSFGSSKDGCSESGKSDSKATSKSKKSSNDNPKSKTKKSRSKKKENKYIDEKDDGESDIFPLVTPLKIKGKKNEKEFSEKINAVETEVPRSVGKSQTPKNLTRPKNHSNSEERLKTTYLKECDFKVPKSASKAFKTPSKTSKPDVPSSPALSFLSSLSEMTAGLPCHPDALVYKKNFKSKREELTKRLFTLYNKEVFDNQLPADMLIQWNSRMTSTSGYCYNKRIYRDNQILRSSRIVLSTKILDRADRLRDTLIHELCHAATWIVHATSDGHGPLWRSWADKANRRFPELPVIKRCHDYAISTKFTYKCMSCGYSIGRHTKSLDTDRKRCGYCFGKFQVFVTAKMSSASVTSGSDSVKTPRNPTGFALFVKENYAIIKKENNVPHAQVMKLLSQKFAEVKISKQNADQPILIE